jgi:hypothetical protein
MRVASQGGWVILNGRPLRAKWLGHTRPSAVALGSTRDPNDGADVMSPFGVGEGGVGVEDRRGSRILLVGENIENSEVTVLPPQSDGSLGGAIREI